MPIDKTASHEKIVKAAKKEFLSYGFNEASMRRIANEAGMSVAGLYKHFASKEEMFSTLVEPAYQGLLSLFKQEEGEMKEFAGAGDLSLLESNHEASFATNYIYDNLDAFKLLVCKSQGTKYENFIHDIALLEEKITKSFMGTLKATGVKINDFDEHEFHLLATANANAVFGSVRHGFNREQALHYADTLDRFFSKAWKEFFGY